MAQDTKRAGPVDQMQRTENAINRKTDKLNGTVLNLNNQTSKPIVTFNPCINLTLHLPLL